MNNPFEFLNSRLSTIESLLLDLKHNQNLTPPHTTTTTTQGNKYLTASDASKFLGIAKQTLYQSISKVPHTKRFGKLYFLESDLTAYLEGGQSK